MVSTATAAAALHPLFTRHGGKIYDGRQGYQLWHIISGVVVVYHVTIVALGQGLLRKC